MEKTKFNLLVEQLLTRELNPIVRATLKKYPNRRPQEASYILVPNKPEHNCSDCGELIRHRTVEYTVRWTNYRQGTKTWRKNCGLCLKKLD